MKDSRKHKKLTKLLAKSNERRRNSLKDANVIKYAIVDLSACAFNSSDEWKLLGRKTVRHITNEIAVNDCVNNISSWIWFIQTSALNCELKIEYSTQFGTKIAIISIACMVLSANCGGNIFILQVRKSSVNKSIEQIIKDGMEATIEISSNDLFSSLGTICISTLEA